MSIEEDDQLYYLREEKNAEEKNAELKNANIN